MSEIRACQWVRLPDGEIGVVCSVDFWRGQWGADVAIPGRTGRRWAAVDTLIVVECPPEYRDI